MRDSAATVIILIIISHNCVTQLKCSAVFIGLYTSTLWKSIHAGLCTACFWPTGKKTAKISCYVHETVGLCVLLLNFLSADIQHSSVTSGEQAQANYELTGKGIEKE
jgi:hypothetical protein